MKFIVVKLNLTETNGYYVADFDADLFAKSHRLRLTKLVNSEISGQALTLTYLAEDVKEGSSNLSDQAGYFPGS
jgi:hypothetical protein